MLQKIQLDVYENNKIIDAVENMTHTDPEHLIKALEEFRQLINEKLTQKIAVDVNDIDDYNIEDEMNSSDDEQITENCGSPKKRKTTNNSSPQ